MPRAYPPYAPGRGPRRPLEAAIRDRGGPVAGRLERTANGFVLADRSARVALRAVAPTPPEPPEGCRDVGQVSGRLVLEGDGAALVDLVVHAPARGPSPDPDLRAKLALLDKRHAVERAVRAYFDTRGFLEARTPTRVRCPGLEPHLAPFPAGAGRYLVTSPELHLKRLVAAGGERVYELARAFRDDERGPMHRPEFTLLEWYRAWEGLDALEDDCEALVAAALDAVGLDAAEALEVLGVDLRAPFARTTVREALAAATGLDLAEHRDRDALARAARRLGHRVAEDDTWDEVFFRLWVAAVEPALGRERPVFVHGYPASQAALARTALDDDGFPVAERFELYVAGFEIANAFHELNDPDEQRARHASDREARRRAGSAVPDLDEAFLASLVAGMPPASGIALGVDRLVAVVTGADGIDEVIAFPDDD